MVAGADMLEEILGPFPVVRLRGLPFEAQMRDIILFFQVKKTQRKSSQPPLRTPPSDIP